MCVACGMRDGGGGAGGGGDGGGGGGRGHWEAGWRTWYWI